MTRLRHVPLLAIGLAACAGSEVRPSVLLVTWDTVRADHVGAREVTPTWSALSAESTVFTAARSPAPVTLPAHASLLTGLEPPRHGARSNGWFHLAPEVETLPERASAAGWRTAAFVSAAVLDARYGLDQGFGVYDAAVGESPGGRHFAERRADATVAAASEWLLAQQSETPVWLWVHLFDPHRPWQSPLPGFVGRPYDAEIAFADQQTGKLLRVWESTGRLESSVVVLTSDHGEGLGDHGEETHGFFAYDSTVRVPLLVRLGAKLGPAARGVRLDGAVSLVDLGPTLGELMGLPGTALDGRSLAGSLRSGAAVPARELPVECVTGALEYGTAPIFAVVDERGDTWFDLPRREHYAATDTAQGTDLYGLAADAEADALFARHDRAWPPPSFSQAPDAEEQARLEALGYLEASPPALEGPDPKDALELVQLRQGGSHALTPAAALERLEVLAGTWGDAPVIGQLRVDLLDQLGRVAEADALLAARPEGEAWSTRELERRRSRRAADEALEVRIEAARVARPTDPDPAYDLGVVRRRLGDLDGASEAFRAALALRPSDREALRELVSVAIAQGDLAGAAALLEPVRADPSAWGDLACEAGRLSGHHLEQREEAATLMRACEAAGGELSAVERSWLSTPTE